MEFNESILRRRFKNRPKNGYKICPRCQKLKLLKTGFPRNVSALDGRGTYCFICSHKYGVSLAERIKSKQRKRRWASLNKEKTSAYGKVKSALGSGKLKKEPCFLCDKKIVHAHHLSYEFPLKVIWLCPSHHSNYHLIQKYAKKQQ